MRSFPPTILRMMHKHSFQGPVFDAIHERLGPRSFYNRFREGTLSPGEFCAHVDDIFTELVEAGIGRGDVPFIKRFPASPKAFVRATLEDLYRRSQLSTATCDEDKMLAVAEELRRDFQHGGYSTYIYPEEGMLLFALADILRPQRVLFLGSYYGYWAHWALPAIIRHGGRVTLVDPNPATNQVAQQNLDRFGYRDHVTMVTGTGEQFLSRTDATYDFMVLDAENPLDHPDSEQRGKRVYGSLISACFPFLEPDCTVVSHNILFREHKEDAHLRQVIERNQAQMERFVSRMRDFSFFAEYTSTEGVGIARGKRSDMP